VTKKLALAAALTLALATSFAQAADIVPINFDGDNEGYNDPTPAAPVGGNPGTTIGEQRQIVAQFAADLWSGVLVSPQPIYVAAQFNPLGANVLGSAGATSAWINFPNAAYANTIYSVALAEARSNTNLNGNVVDISSQFSSDFTFYYGLDGNTPAGQVNFLDVVMHEFGHGLGFQNFEDEASGNFLAGLPDIYSVFTYDNTAAKFWTQMTVAQRRASALNYGKVVFTGASAVAGAPLVLGPRTAFRISAPAGIAGDYEYGTATFGPAATPDNFAGNVVLAIDPSDGAGASTNDACSPLTNAAAVAGNVALVTRGTCGFVTKVKNAQDAGATAVIVSDNAAGNPPPGLGGSDPTITIPAVRVTLADGNAIKANLPGVAMAFVVDPTKLQGADNANRPRLFMPNPVQPGSSGSHYDTALLPNALMEPVINTSLLSAFNLDITPNLLQDTGWTLNAGNAKIGACDTGIDIVDGAGNITGANVQAQSNVCLVNAQVRGDYQGCMDAYKERLLALNLVTGKQAGKMMACAAKLGK
jgi:hypothetical protein